jgi:hypothetical protein
MIVFAFCFMMGKVHGWGTFPKWEVGLSQGLLVWKCPSVFFFQSTTGARVVNIQALHLDFKGLLKL